MSKSAIYRYRSLPSGNACDFPSIDVELRRRGVQAEVSDLPTGGRIYRILVSDLPKMPSDEKGPYFGDDESGWSLSSAEIWEDYRVKWDGSEWRSL